MLGREAKLGCEATFSPDLNPCHLDSCLVGGDNEAALGGGGPEVAGLVTAGDLVHTPPVSPPLSSGLNLPHWPKWDVLPELEGGAGG